MKNRGQLCLNYAPESTNFRVTSVGREDGWGHLPGRREQGAPAELHNCGSGAGRMAAGLPQRRPIARSAGVTAGRRERWRHLVPLRAWAAPSALR